MRFRATWLLVALAAVGACSLAGGPRPGPTPGTFPTVADEAVPADEPVVATFGSGCFWCTEAVFRQLNGVKTVTSGYCGGTVPDPSYEQVCSGKTGHAEVVQVTFDPAVVSYPELLHVFWRSHDPTTKDRQGADAGAQYRSVVFTHSERQRRLAEAYKAKIDAAGAFPGPVVTEIVPFAAFYPAEADHQNYFEANPRARYCRAVIGPKVEKLRAVFADKLKPGPG